MLWTIVALLLILWLLGMVSTYTLGGFIHILLVIAVIAVLVLASVAGMWLLFCLTLLLAVGALANAVRDPNSYPGERALYAVLGCASATLSIVFGFRVYQNFRQHARQSKR